MKLKKRRLRNITGVIAKRNLRISESGINEIVLGAKFLEPRIIEHIKSSVHNIDISRNLRNTGFRSNNMIDYWDYRVGVVQFVVNLKLFG